PDLLMDLQAVAEQAAIAAGTVALEGYRGVLEITSKGGTDIVTQYDHAAEAAALGILRAHFPNHSFLGEESGLSSNQGESADFVWMVDPIDGTHNYANQLPFWCVSVAVAQQSTGQVLAGVIYDPLHNELFTARKGAGATLNGKPIHTTTKTNIADAIVAYDIGHTPDISHRMVELIAWVEPHVAKVRHLGSAALSLTYVAVGRLDAYYHLSLQPWDVAAAIILIEEAGGKTTDWFGAPRLASAGSAVASGENLHASLLDLLSMRENS
ncbi:MAG: inositol monophosphatase family protein, partial [Chloroflexia bacterium]